MDGAAKCGGNTCVISTGWDPGLFSIMRAMGKSILPQGRVCAFWGKGVSRGHTDAIKEIEGVLDAVQYTIPKDGAVALVRSGDYPALTPREKHIRVCYVTAEEGAELARIEREIVTMRDYFADYDTTVHFVSQGELEKSHSDKSHKGVVFCSGKTGNGNIQRMEFSLDLGSNPEFTGYTMMPFARAAYRLNQEGVTGAKTVFDIAPKYLFPGSSEEMMNDL